MSMTCTDCQSAATETCTACRAALCGEHTYKGQPYITARQLVTTTASTAIRTPRLLGDILFKELEQVAYCATCRQDLAVKRQSEQVKFLLIILLLFAVAISVPLYFMLAG